MPAKCNLLHDDIRHHQEAGLGDQCDSTEHRACARSGARTLRSLFATHTCSFTGFVFSRHNQQIVDSRDSLINRAQGSNLAPSETFALYLCSSNKEPYHTQCNAQMKTDELIVGSCPGASTAPAIASSTKSSRQNCNCSGLQFGS